MVLLAAGTAGLFRLIYPRLPTTVGEVPVVTVDQQSIAVLPFDNLSNDPANDPFTAGIHDDILTQISQIGALRVISRTSVERLDRNQKIQQIARQLGVANILEGGVQRIGDHVRINVQLIDGRSDSHLWSQRYDRELSVENVFAIQSEIATEVARNLKATLSSAEKARIQTPRTSNLAAYEAYLLGRQQIRNRNSDALVQAIGFFQKAIDLDSKYALAYLGLAESYRLSSTYGRMTRAESAARTEPLVNKALELDDQLGEAHAALGNIKSSRYDFDGAEAAFSRAIELNPNYADTYLGYAGMLRSMNRHEESLAQLRKARELDPLSGAINANIAQSLNHLARFAEGLEQFHKTIDVAPDYAGAYYGLGDSYWMAFGRLDRAYRWRKKAFEIDPGDPIIAALLGLLCLDLDDPGHAAPWIEHALNLGSGRVRPNLAQELLHLYQGEHEKALQFAERVLAIDPGFRIALAHLSGRDVHAGRYAEARARYAGPFPEFFATKIPTVEY